MLRLKAATKADGLNHRDTEDTENGGYARL
jgi:hypothetical protein